MNYKRTALLLCLLAGGLYCAGTALWHLGRTAVFVHESTSVAARVVDMEKRPFESWSEALRHGNLPWDGDTAYRPFVSCTLPKEPVPIPIHRLKVNDLDNQDYTTGQEVEIILPLAEPEQVHLKRFKFLWGGDCLLLLAGLLLGTAGYLPLRYGKRRRKSSAKPKAKPQLKPQPKPEPKPEPAPQPRPEPSAPKPKAKSKAKAPAEEEPFRLESTPPEPAKKKRTRKPKDPNAPAKPRKPRKKKTE